MKLSTIWTIGAMTFRERLNRTGEWLAQKIAASLPKNVRYWAFIQEASRGIGNMPPTTVVPEVRLFEVVDAL